MSGCNAARRSRFALTTQLSRKRNPRTGAILVRRRKRSPMKRETKGTRASEPRALSFSVFAESAPKQADVGGASPSLSPASFFFFFLSFSKRFPARLSRVVTLLLLLLLPLSRTG